MTADELPSRVMHAMQLLQALPRHMRVYLRGGNICMAQQHLHHAQICAVIEQMCGEGVAQHMRAHMFRDARYKRVAFD